LRHGAIVALDGVPGNQGRGVGIDYSHKAVPLIRSRCKIKRQQAVLLSHNPIAKDFTDHVLISKNLMFAKPFKRK
jgi:hypothetical protein